MSLARAKSASATIKACADAYCPPARRPHGRFLTESRAAAAFCATYFFSAGKKSKQKSPLARLCSSSNYLLDLAGRRNVLPALYDSIYILVN
jgi:hypothetical protein